MSDYGISILSTYSGLSDYDLENEIISIISEFPHVGYMTISAILKTKGHRVQFSRVRSAVRNVDPQRYSNSKTICYVSSSAEKNLQCQGTFGIVAPGRKSQTHQVDPHFMSFYRFPVDFLLFCM